MQTQPVTEQMEKLNLDIENMMKQAEKTVKDEMGRLFDSDQVLKNAVDHVAKCTEGELERVKSVAEAEIGDMKKKVQDEFESVKVTMDNHTQSMDAAGRIAALEQLGASHVQLIEQSRRQIQSTMSAHGEFITLANHRMENIEAAHGSRCHCDHVEEMIPKVNALAAEYDRRRGATRLWRALPLG